MGKLQELLGTGWAAQLRQRWRDLAGLGPGTAVALLGLLSLASPLLGGTTDLVGLLLVLGGSLEVLFSFRIVGLPAQGSAYSSGLITLVMGLVVLGAPMLVGSALVLLLALSFAMDGVQSLATARAQVSDRRAMAWSLASALGNLALAAGLLLARFPVGLTLGVAGGLRLLGRGSAMAASPTWSLEEAGDTVADDLGLPDDPELDRLCAELAASEAASRPHTRAWIAAFAATLFAIHVGRMPLDEGFLGVTGPLVAVLGDGFVAVLVSFGVLVPAHALTRYLLRAPEKRAWSYAWAPHAPRTPVRRLVRALLAWRLRGSIRIRQSRYSLLAALERGLAVGLPVAAVVAATVPVWGMSWYFDTENWASGVYDSWAAQRTTAWRTEMVRAVTGGAQESFEVHPPGTEGDFGFLVIGDTGEGDASQLVLKDQLMLAGLQPEVKFLVLSSDVVYPSGSMADYEDKFYLPFKGFRHPIYAIPGNHDWYDGLEGFTANFFQPGAAATAMRARVEADRHLTSTTEAMIARDIEAAAVLRQEYGLSVGFQRAPYFQVQTPDFVLIAVDTGVLKDLDPDQRRWLERALEQARGKFKMVVLGHPFFAGGHDVTEGYPDFASTKRLLASHGVQVAMAGDTHDFEVYRGRGTEGMLCFVNGGGGAYLSQGTSLSWPRRPATSSWDFYPSRQAVVDKLDRLVPTWQRPLWWWTRYADAWPFSAEWLSAAFDYNRAPYFQSFMEVRVLRSRGEVRLRLWGVHGPLRWSDLSRTEGFGAPDGVVEFVLPMKP